MTGSQEISKPPDGGLDASGGSADSAGPTKAADVSNLQSGDGGSSPTAFNADDAVLGAVVSSEWLTGLDRALDQLTHSVDLFEIPAADLGVHDSHFHGTDGQG